MIEEHLIESDNAEGIHKIFLDIDAPLSFDKQEIEYNKIAIFVGTNGSGKSFILKLTWVLMYIFSIISNGRKMGMGAMLNLVQIAQIGFKYTFDDCDINGNVGVQLNSGATVSVDLEKGNVVNCTIEYLEPDVVIDFPTYMSSEFRTFNAVKFYLRDRKRLVGTNKAIGETNMPKMLEDFKMYDITHIERLIASTPINLEVCNLIEEFGEDYPVTLDVDLENCDFKFTTVKGNTFNTCTLGNGHQAILHIKAATAHN